MANTTRKLARPRNINKDQLLDAIKQAKGHKARVCQILGINSYNTLDNALLYYDCVDAIAAAKIELEGTQAQMAVALQHELFKQAMGGNTAAAQTLWKDLKRHVGLQEVLHVLITYDRETIAALEHLARVLKAHDLPVSDTVNQFVAMLEAASQRQPVEVDSD